MTARPRAQVMAGTALLELDDPVRGRLVISRGETVVLLGPSGAGKTRLVRTLLGLEASGPEPVLSVRGRRAHPRDVAALVGWVPEGDGVFLSDSIWDNVAHPPGVAPHDADLARDALDLVGLADRIREPVVNLPRRGRRRVALARHGGPRHGRPAGGPGAVGRARRLHRPRGPGRPLVGLTLRSPASGSGTGAGCGRQVRLRSNVIARHDRRPATAPSA